MIGGQPPIIIDIQGGISMESNEIKKAFLDSYEILNDKKVNNANFDKTIQGTIIDCKDPSVGRYLVRYQDSTIEAYSVSPSVDYPKGNLVYISVPQGNIKNQKTILGSAKQLGTNYIEELIQEDTFDATKNLLQTDLEISLSSYQSEDTIIPSSFTEGLEGEIRNANFLKIKGKVRTNLVNQQKRDGRYGLKIILIVRNNATGIEEEQDYYFDSNSFSGNPYNYETAITQEVSHPLDGINFVRVKSISKFVQGFPLQEEGKEPDIFLSNISINGSYKLSDTEKATVGIVLEAPYGYTFTESSKTSGSTVRPIKANIRAKGKLVDLDRQNVEIYWFKADPRITPTHEDYLKYGGSGWKCINPEKLSNSSIEIPMDMVQYNRENLFKCVAVYDNKTFSKQFTIYNYDAKYEVSIESTEGVNFAYSTGHPNLICHVLKDGEELNQGIRYQWKSVNSQNVNEDLNDTDTSQYQKKSKEMKQIEFIVNTDEEAYWNQQIKKVEAIKYTQNIYNYTQENYIGEEHEIYDNPTQENPNLTWQQRYDELKDFTSNFEKSQRVEGNTIYNLNLYKIIDYTTFYCSCFIGDELIGTAKIVIYNQAAALAGYNLVINNGDQVFLYDQNGMSLQSAAIDQPYNISDLSYTLIYNGVPIDEQQLAFAIPTWKIPLKNTMIEMGQQDISGDYLYKKGSTLTFDVSNKYNVSNSNNDIYLTLQYNDQTFTTKTNFTFNKQGGIGTNGTKYQFKIVPNKNILYFSSKGDYKSGSNSIEVIPQMWYNGKRTQKNFNISWEVLQDKTALNKWSNLVLANQSNQEAIKNENKGIFGTKGFGLRSNNPNKQDSYLGNIIKATATQNELLQDLKYYATVPISTVFYHDDSYIDDMKMNIEIPDDAGFKYVTYKNDGTNPSYNELKPFEVDIYKTIGSRKENISNKKSEQFSYEWKVLPQGKSALEIISTNNNTAEIRPKDNFSKAGNQVTNAVLIQIKKEKKSFATIHIPIHMMLNRYENAALNDWDGNTIDINDNGYILTPQVGAGKKEGNAFTGVLLGIERALEKNKLNENKVEDKVGLFGYAAGARSIFLDAATGNATFGLPDKGQIEIDVQNQAIIRSGDYEKQTVNDEKRNKNLKGMQIQFSGDPHIYFSSGNFMVDSQGKITARGGGSIAGWNINDKTLSKGYVTISSDNSKNTNQAIKVTNGQKNIFSVDYRGFLHSEQGDIAGWTIESDKLHNVNIGMAPKDWVLETIEIENKKIPIYTGVFWAGAPAKDSRIINNGKNFYTRNFFVTQSGYLFSKDGKIGGWDIKSDRLINDKGNVGMSTGIKIGNLTGVCFWGGTVSTSNQISLNFWVTNSGVLHARRGELGDWKIANGGLYSDGKEGSVEQKIYTYDKKTNTYTEVKRTKTSSGIKSNDKDNYTYNNTSGGVYVGADGIRFGDYFRVTQAGGLQATGGKIGDISIDGSGLSANNWRIDGSGTAYFTNAYINGSNIVQCALSGRSSGGGVSGGGMRMGSGGAGSSYMSPGVRTSPNGQSWEDYIENKIKESLTRDKIINALQDGNYTINFGDYQIRANELSAVGSVTAGSNVYADNMYAGGKLATEDYVDNKINSIPKPATS